MDRFVVGPENHLLRTVLYSVLEATPNGRNPLVLYGPPGTGKSHLARGLFTVWKALSGCWSKQPVTAVEFRQELEEAIETRTIDSFRTPYRRTSLLVIEDLHHLVNKEATQRELLFTLDALVDAGRWVVLTARSAPGRLAGFIPRLQARLIGGLTVPLARPGFEARLVILRRLARLRGIDLPKNAARLLAEGIDATVPELLGALIQLDAGARIDNGVINGQSVRCYLAQQSDLRRPSVHKIALLAARHFALKLSDLRSPSRRRAVATARGVAIYLARKLTSKSLEQIGHFFGGRDHTTVSYACKKTEQRIAMEPAVRDTVTLLENELRAT